MLYISTVDNFNHGVNESKFSLFTLKILFANEVF